MRFLNAASWLLVAAASTRAEPLPGGFRFRHLEDYEVASNRSLEERGPWDTTYHSRLGLFDIWRPETGWKTAVEKGTRLWKDIVDGRYTDKQAITPENDHWRVGEYLNIEVDSTLRPMVRKFAQSEVKENVQITFVHRGGPSTGTQEVDHRTISFYRFTYCPEDKVIICDFSEKAREGPEPAQLFWSDIFFAGWKRACERSGLPLSSLKYIFKGDVVSIVTTGVIAHAYKTYQGGASINNEVTWYPTGDTREAFLALLGSPNGYGIGKFLLEHGSALGKKTITSVVTENSINPINPAEKDSKARNFQNMVWQIDDALPPGTAGGGDAPD